MRRKKLKPIKKLKTPYLGGDDVGQWIHSNKTHRSVSEAFRDADYATAFWREKSDWEQTLEFLGGAVLGFMWVGVLLGGIFCFIYWLVH